jgi:hypothetical protein
MDRRSFLKAAGAASLFAPAMIKDALAANEAPLVAVAEGDQEGHQRRRRHAQIRQGR